jgi:CxxC-x17-CxxC domain-containing protein
MKKKKEEEQEMEEPQDEEETEEAQEETEEVQEEEQYEEPAEEEQAAGEGKKDRFGRTLYSVKCSDCGRNTEVPFKPSGDRPVYCRDCYQKHRPKRRF